MDCCSPGDSPLDRQFDASHAASTLRADRRKDPAGMTRALIEALVAGGIDGQTVALGRVICCYADMAALVGRSASLARRRYGVVYPRDTWLGRVGVAFLNAVQRLSRLAFRVYIHRAADVDAILAAHGLQKRLHRTTLIWQIAVYERPAA